MPSYQSPNGCIWFCNVCGQPVDANDMVGYFYTVSGLGSPAVPIPNTLGFWHNNVICGNPALRGSMANPSDIPIRNFVNIIPQEIYDWLMDGISPKEVGIMAMRCLIPGFEQTFRDYAIAQARGVTEPNLCPPALWPHEISAILEWQQKGRP